MSSTLNYLFNVGGNFDVKLNDYNKVIGDFSAKISQVSTVFDKFQMAIVKFNVRAEFLSHLGRMLSSISAPMITLDQGLKDLSALTGVVGGDLQEIERYARSTAKTFGIDASSAVESYKLLLSQLSPELAKQPEALRSMGEHVATLSKLMGGDAVGAVEVLTTAMNQYGVDLSDPIEASKKMAEMMNVMAAAGKEGSSELPTIKVALEQAGMAAKAAGVSFEETNSAIQVLDKAGKKGSEGGVALRNVLSTLAQGRFLPKDVQQDLLRAGIDINMLGDKSKSLSERLNPLKPLLNDTALLTKLFGKENANAAMALISGTQQMDEWTKAITGTNNAQEQATVIMESYAEKQARIRQSFEDIKISMASSLGDVGIWISTVVEGLTPFAQFIPIITSLAGVIHKASIALIFMAKNMMVSSYSHFVTMIRRASLSLAFMRRDLITGNIVTLSFTGNTVRASMALMRFATIGILNAIKGVGALILSLITGGATSASFAGIASASFATFSSTATVACRAVTVAISSIPIVGWIAIAVTAIGTLSYYLWNHSVKFRAVIKGLWAFVKAYFMGIWQLASKVFSAIGKLIMSAFKLDWGGIKDALGSMKNGFVGFGTDLAQSFSKAYNQEIENSRKGEEAKKNPGRKGAKNSSLSGTIPSLNDSFSIPSSGTNVLGGSLSSSPGMSSDGNGKIRNITITIDKLVDKFEIRTTNLSHDVSKVKELVSEALLSAVNDVSLAN